MQTTAPVNLVEPEDFLKVAPLEVVAMRVVEGLLSGRHRSPFKGGCIEFSEHRAYSPGDEIRMMDWRAFARTDRYYIKRFEEETNLNAVLVLDASGSMAFGHSTVTKFRYAQAACACLARLLLQQRDAVGLAVADTKIRSFIPARCNPSHFAVLAEAMSTARPGGENSLANVLHALARRIKRRGLVLLVSDCFDDVDALKQAFRRLRAHGHEVLLLHVMAPEELTFTFSKWSRFVSLEVQGQTLDLDPAMIRPQYLERVQLFMEQLRAGCGESMCDYCSLTTDRPLGEALAYYLARRAARNVKC